MRPDPEVGSHASGYMPEVAFEEVASNQMGENKVRGLNRLKWLPLCLAAVTLASCGGGGGGGSGGGGGGTTQPPATLGTLSGIYDLNVATELLMPTTVTVSSPSLPAGMRCSKSSGVIPAGMTLNADCSLSGTASEPGQFRSQLSVTVAGYTGSATVNLSVQVDGPLLSVTEPNNPRMLSAIDGNGKATLRDQGLFSARVGDKTVYSVTGGRLPNGVTLDPATGQFTGIPVELGKFSVTIGAAFERNGGRATFSVSSGDFYVLEPSINYSYYSGFVGPIDLGPITPVTPQLLGSLGPLHTVKFEFVGVAPAGFVIDSTTGVISGSADVPGSSQLAVRVFIADATGATYPVETAPIDVQVRGVLPVYDRFECPGVPCYVATHYESIYRSISAYTVKPSAMYQGKSGDVYSFEIQPPSAPRTLPSWVAVDKDTGDVTIAPVQPGDSGPYGMVLKVTTVRNGKAISSLQRWDFSVNF